MELSSNNQPHQSNDDFSIIFKILLTIRICVVVIDLVGISRLSKTFQNKHGGAAVAKHMILIMSIRIQTSNLCVINTNQSNLFSCKFFQNLHEGASHHIDVFDWHPFENLEKMLQTNNFHKTYYYTDPPPLPPP